MNDDVLTMDDEEQQMRDEALAEAQAETVDQVIERTKEVAYSAYRAYLSIKGWPAPPWAMIDGPTRGLVDGMFAAFHNIDEDAPFAPDAHEAFEWARAHGLDYVHWDALVPVQRTAITILRAVWEGMLLADLVENAPPPEPLTETQPGEDMLPEVPTV